ncbi:MAG: hypothetical protein O3C40_18340, partial [Planctomycetota bacterium]|nr:hypothetical protein [Planctomycetota bacterium]
CCCDTGGLAPCRYNPANRGQKVPHGVAQGGDPMSAQGKRSAALGVGSERRLSPNGAALHRRAC